MTKHIIVDNNLDTPLEIRLLFLERKLGKHIHIFTRAIEAERKRQENIENLFEKIEPFMQGLNQSISEIIDRTEKLPREEHHKSVEEIQENIAINADELMMKNIVEQIDINKLSKQDQKTISEFKDHQTTLTHEAAKTALGITLPKFEAVGVNDDIIGRIKIYRGKDTTQNLDELVKKIYVTSRHEDPTQAKEWNISLTLNTKMNVHTRPKSTSKRPRSKKFRVSLGIEEASWLRSIIQKNLNNRTFEDKYFGLYLKLQHADYEYKGKRPLIFAHLKITTYQLYELYNKLTSAMRRSRYIRITEPEPVKDTNSNKGKNYNNNSYYDI